MAFVRRSRPQELVDLLKETGPIDKLDCAWWFGLSRAYLDSVVYCARYYGHVPAGMVLRAHGGIVALEKMCQSRRHTLEDVEHWT